MKNAATLQRDGESDCSETRPDDADRCPQPLPPRVFFFHFSHVHMHASACTSCVFSPVMRLSARPRKQKKKRRRTRKRAFRCVLEWESCFCLCPPANILPVSVCRLAALYAHTHARCRTHPHKHAQLRPAGVLMPDIPALTRKQEAH